MKNTTLFAIIAFLCMFIISGITKVTSFGASESARLATKLPTYLAKHSQMLVFIAGLWELISSFAIIYGSIYDKKDISLYGIYSLISFVILVTFIFYAFPLKYKPALSNLSVATGLYLMANICFFKN
jgi:hypothetical protein